MGQRRWWQMTWKRLRGSTPSLTQIVLEILVFRKSGQGRLAFGGGGLGCRAFE